LRCSTGTAVLARANKLVWDERIDPEKSLNQTLPLGQMRQAVLAMLAIDEIGDDGFHLMEQEPDSLEMAGKLGRLKSAPSYFPLAGIS
jgi:hypothetical protein